MRRRTLRDEKRVEYKFIPRILTRRTVWIFACSVSVNLQLKYSTFSEYGKYLRTPLEIPKYRKKIQQLNVLNFFHFSSVERFRVYAFYYWLHLCLLQLTKSTFLLFVAKCALFLFLIAIFFIRFCSSRIWVFQYRRTPPPTRWERVSPLLWFCRLFGSVR